MQLNRWAAALCCGGAIYAAFCGGIGGFIMCLFNIAAAAFNLYLYAELRRWE